MKRVKESAGGTPRKMDVPEVETRESLVAGWMESAKTKTASPAWAYWIKGKNEGKARAVIVMVFSWIVGSWCLSGGEEVKVGRKDTAGP